MESKTITEPAASKQLEIPSPLRAFIHVLVWDAAVLRIIIEGLVVMLVYYELIVLLSHVYPSAIDVAALHVTVVSILLVTMMYCDSAFLCSGATKMQSSFHHACRGNFDQAIDLLSDSLKAYFPPPRGIALLQLAELEIMLNYLEKSKRSLERALLHGIPKGVCLFYAMRGNLFAAKSEEVGAAVSMFEIPDDIEDIDKVSLRLERAFYLLCQGRQLPQARREFSSVRESMVFGHPSKTSTQDLSLLGELLCDLHLGKADEVLPQLEAIVPFIVAHAEANDGLRPYAAFFLLERARYFSKRRNTKWKMREDVLSALSICRFPAHLEIAKGMLALS